MFKKIKKFTLLIVLFAFVFSYSNFTIFSIDNSWEMNFGLNILEGNLPYKDFTMIIPPLYPLLTSFFLFLFKNNYGYELLNAAIIVSYIYSANILFKKRFIDGNQYFYFAPLLFFASLVFGGYNYLIIIFANLIVYFIIEYFNTNKKINLIISGIIGSFVILTKHSTGGVVFLLFFLTLLFFLYKENKIKYIVYFLFSFIIIFSLFISYLILNNIFIDFIEYTILNIPQFAQKNITALEKFIANKNAIIYFISLIIITIFNIYFSFKIKDKMLTFLVIAAIGNTVCIFPIVNFYHIVCAIIGFLVPTILIINHFIEINTKNKYVFLFTLFIVVCLFLKITSTYIYAQQNCLRYNGGFFQNIYLEKKYGKELEDINTYMSKHKNNNYLTPEAINTLVRLSNGEISTKPLDIFNNGNLGIKPSIEIINEINTDNTYLYLYKKESQRERNHQTPLEAINYIKNNYTLVDTTEYFEIYKIP